MDDATTQKLNVPFATERFKITRGLGQGGMGMVYEAVDQELNARVAIKTLKSMDPDGLLRFKNEFREFQNVSHPNLVSLGELFSNAGDWFFSMELIEGTTFLDWVRPYSTSLRADEPTKPLGAKTDPMPIGDDSSGNEPTLVKQRVIRDGQSGGILNVDRLKDATRQLCLGLIALHEAGKIHRDVKPSNVLVTPTGRVVILDFGLSSNDDRATETSASADIIGTVAYMSPEQAAGNRVGPAADWYAVGVMMFQAITGLLPFEGEAMRILYDKQIREAPRCKDYVPDIDPHLDETVAQLLSFNSGKRLTGQNLLKRLGQASAPETMSFSLDNVFIGRQEQLASLREAYTKVQKHGPQVVCLTGESGLGKTSLVKYFTHQLESDPKVVLLEGACFERESVPYKAIDGALDSLSRALARMRNDDALSMLPRQASLLSHFFPVLARVEAIAAAPLLSELPKDPVEQRNRLFTALRELLQRLGDRRQVVMFIDDIQWSDADSWLLLSDVFRAPDAPKLLLVTTLRTSGENTVEKWSQKLADVFPSGVKFIPVQRLAENDSLRLAQTLLTKLGKNQLDADAIMRESDGHPLFIDALARRDERITEGNVLSLEDTLWQQAEKLDPRARRILEVVSIATGPISQETVLRAAEVEPDQFSKLIGSLRVGHFVRSTGLRAADMMLPYHDRVRQSVRRHLGTDEQMQLHRRVGISMEMLGAKDPEALVHHWREAGDHPRAMRYNELAADRAVAALAFDRAADHLSYLLEHGSFSREKTFELNGKLGSALANAGRGKEAAQAFLKASQTTESYAAFEMQGKAADQLMRCGYVEEGVGLLKSLLKLGNLKMSPTPFRALVNLVGLRALLAVRGLGYKSRDTGQIPTKKILAVDASWIAAEGLSHVDVITAAEMQVKNLLLALRLGDSARIARALCMEAVLVSTGGVSSYDKACALITRAMKIIEPLQNQNLSGLAETIRGVVAFQSGKWTEAVEWTDKAIDRLESNGVGAIWELNSAYICRYFSLYYLGDVRRFSAGLPITLQTAKRRGDIFTGMHLSLSHLNMYWLFRDEPNLAHNACQDAVRLLSSRSYDMQHYYALVAKVQLALYGGENLNAAAFIAAEWPRLSGSMALRVQIVRIDTLFLKGRVLAAQEVLDVPRLKDCIHGLKKENTEVSNALSAMLNCALVYRTTGTSALAEAVDKALIQLKVANMRLMAQCVEYAAARLTGRTTEANAIAAAMKTVGICNVEKLVSVMSPGLGLPLPQQRILAA